MFLMLSCGKSPSPTPVSSLMTDTSPTLLLQVFLPDPLFCRIRMAAPSMQTICCHILPWSLHLISCLLLLPQASNPAFPCLYYGTRGPLRFRHAQPRMEEKRPKEAGWPAYCGGRGSFDVLEGPQAQGCRQKARPNRARGTPWALKSSPRPRSSRSSASWRLGCPGMTPVGKRGAACCPRPSPAP